MNSSLFLFQAEYQLQERYFSVLVKKEQMEEKMRNIREMKCRAVTCKKVLSQKLNSPLTQVCCGCLSEVTEVNRCYSSAGSSVVTPTSSRRIVV